MIMKLMSNDQIMKASFKYTLVILTAIVSVISCKKAEENKSLARFACKIMTKVNDSAWEAGDSVGISGISGNRTYSNLCYTTPEGSSEDFSPTGEAIYYLDSDPVTFTAYYPWKAELIENQQFGFSVKKQSEMKAFDFLWAEAVGEKEDTNPVSFIFAHKMSQLVITIKGVNGAEYDLVSRTVCGLSGISTEGSFDRQTGKVSTAEAPSETLIFINNTEKPEYNTSVIKENKKDNSISYTTILLPQEFSEANPMTFQVDVPIFQDGTPVHYNVPIDLSQIQGNDGKNALQGGYQYDIILKISNKSVTATVTDIIPWIDSEESSTEATM